MRRTRLRSALAMGRSLEKERRTRFDFLRRRWLRRCFRRRSFPLPVILKRFAVALCVFILGISCGTPLFVKILTGICRRLSLAICERPHHPLSKCLQPP
jgi:hypothetical protein